MLSISFVDLVRNDLSQLNTVGQKAPACPPFFLVQSTTRPGFHNFHKLTVLTIFLFFSLQGMSPISVLISACYIIFSLTVIGMLFDSSSYAPPMECLRCFALAFFISKGLVLSPGLKTALLAVYAASAMFWGLYTLRFLEIKKMQKVE